MTPPKNAVLFECELATLWMREDGILCGIAKDAFRTLEKQKEVNRLMRKISRGKRVCMLADNTLSSSPIDKETADFIAKEMPEIFKAMAVMSSSMIGKFITNSFINEKHEPVPIKQFNDEKLAVEWLKNFL